MSTHAVSSSKKPQKLLKSFLAATAAVWLFTSDDEECKYVPSHLKTTIQPMSQHTSTESNGNRDELVKQPPFFFLGRPLASFKSDNATTSLNTHYRPSRRIPIAPHQTGLPLRVSGSVYNREFHELGKLGAGAFGSVFRSQNLLDGNTYAIKKIFLPLPTQHHIQRHPSSSLYPFAVSDALRTSLREPQTMASMCKHRNIVQYHHSWLEIHPNWQNHDETTSNSPSRLYDPYPAICTQLITSSSNEHEWTDGYGSDGSDVKETEETLSPNGSNGEKTEETLPPIDNNSDGEEPEQTPPPQDYSSPSSDYSLVLFIQMELCDGASLYDWLRLPGRVVDPAENTRLFRQLIRALSHLHAKNYCHRDVKPANLLIIPKGNRNILKVGDFGCCKRLNVDSELSADSSSLTPLERPSTTTEHTQGCGTFFYMAPELHTKHYGTAVDVFAAGIVLFELFHVFATETERFHLITLLHEKRLVPHAFILSYPLEANLVLKMTHFDPSMRPSTFDLLNDPRYGLCPVQDLANASSTADDCIAS